jgi:hypothetical protein
MVDCFLMATVVALCSDFQPQFLQFNSFIIHSLLRGESKLWISLPDLTASCQIFPKIYLH